MQNLSRRMNADVPAFPPSLKVRARSRYTQGELDMDLVETSSKLALHFFKIRGRKGGSVMEVRDFIKAKGKLHFRHRR